MDMQNKRAFLNAFSKSQEASHDPLLQPVSSEEAATPLKNNTHMSGVICRSELDVISRCHRKGLERKRGKKIRKGKEQDYFVWVLAKTLAQIVGFPRKPVHASRRYMMIEKIRCEAISLVGTRGFGRGGDLHHDLVHRLAIPLSLDRAGEMQGKSRTAMEDKWKRQMAWQMDAPPMVYGLRSAVCGVQQPQPHQRHQEAILPGQWRGPPCVLQTYVGTSVNY